MRTGDCEVPLPPTVLQSKTFSEKISNLSNINGRTYFAIETLEGNIGSISMHKKLGCQLESTCKENIYTNGTYYDEFLFGLTKKDYLKVIDSTN